MILLLNCHLRSLQIEHTNWEETYLNRRKNFSQIYLFLENSKFFCSCRRCNNYDVQHIETLMWLAGIFVTRFYSDSANVVECDALHVQLQSIARKNIRTETVCRYSKNWVIKSHQLQYVVWVKNHQRQNFRVRTPHLQCSACTCFNTYNKHK